MGTVFRSLTPAPRLHPDSDRLSEVSCELWHRYTLGISYPSEWITIYADDYLAPHLLASEGLNGIRLLLRRIYVELQCLREFLPWV